MRLAIARDGRIEQIITLPPDDDGAAHLAALGPGLDAADADETVGLGTHWMSPAGIALRPIPPAPPAMTSGVDASWEGLPPGALVTAVSGISGQVAGSGAADAGGVFLLALPAGPWRLEVAETWPAVASVFEIEVAP